MADGDIVVNQATLPVPETKPETDRSTLPPTPNETTPILQVKSMRSADREFIVELPMGVLIDGEVRREVTLRTLNHADRVFFGNEKLLRNPAKATTQLIDKKIVSIDGFGGAVPTRIVRDMLGQDRDAIIYGLRKATTHDKSFNEVAECPHCEKNNDVEIPTSEVDDTLKKLPDEARRNVNGSRCVFDVELPAWAFKGVIAYSTGYIQEHVGAKLDECSGMELDTLLLNKLIVDVNGEGTVDLLDKDNPFEIEFIDDLQDALREHDYGYEFNPQITCYSCDEKFRVRLSPLDFLFDRLRKRI